ncbi:hypothetical protein EOM09_08380, partial [bacterium]|nr:hypothetical protein [bacterium]
MNNIQIIEIKLYSKHSKGTQRRIRKVEFKIGTLNIIHGLSQTGKSAIIPIIDYCLCSNTNRIPVGVIRDNCSAFSLKLKVDDEYLSIFRSIEKGKTEKIGYCYTQKFEEKNKWKITDPEKFKIHLNNALGIPFIDTDTSNKEEKNDRPSYRDLVSFNFQTQNIVANPNCLLYKTDTYNHRQKIKKIFNYIIGAQTSEQLLNEFNKQKLNNELKDLLYKEAKEEKIRKEVLINSELVLDKAMEYGLIQNKTLNMGDI